MIHRPKLKALIYGDPGSGKTYLVGTFGLCDETAPVLVLNSRGQPITLNLFGINMPCIVNIEKMVDYNLPYRWLEEGQPWEVIENGCDLEPPDPFCSSVYTFLEEFPPEDRKFKTVALDSLTQTQRISMREVVGDKQKLPGDVPPTQTQQHWGKTLGQMTFLADLFFQLDLHVVVTALRRHQYVESAGVTMFYPFFWGQSAMEVPSYAEMLGMLVNVDSLATQQAMAIRAAQSEEGREDAFNALLCRGGRTFTAKWQGVRDPPAVVANPTGEKLVNYLYQ